MLSRNPVYPLPQRAFSVHINGDHNLVSRYKSHSRMETGLNRQESFSFGAIPSPNIPDLTKARQELPLPDSRISALEPCLYGTITHAALIYIYILVKMLINDSNNEIIITDK